MVFKAFGRTSFLAILAGVISTVIAPAPSTASSLGAPAVATTIGAAEWRAYAANFIDRSGRVIDREKGGVSHSEGQGYGLLLSVYADDRATFERILGFTMARMRRGDGLISWLYDPRQYPAIADTNNATDGDILIAYALSVAAVKWNDARFLKTAMPLIDAIGRHLLDDRNGVVRVRPAMFGFEAPHHVDGPVVNLSYYVYGAFLLFDSIDDRHPWGEAWQSGLQMTLAALTGREGLAPDWITLRRDRFMAPASAMPRKSSYDAVRIPLYMALGGRVPGQYFAPFDNAWNVRGNRAPKDYDLAADRAVMDMNDTGYRAIAALAACAARGRPVPTALRRYRTTTYFASSLHLLTLATLRSTYPDCMRNEGQQLSAARLPR
ncbi:glycosyl hydrolase family 8 [Acuticoccus kandeliae]|uniref:glycosyl hydrolase family 8 n=1 Tax=Acuticoccus kandeliae TaxID=2073160 RepID=UPI000D3E9020|nr:glycosyl hydrolase family 8 [Acuticoccus kandeliae]